MVERKRGETAYAIREFPAGSNHTPDAFVAFPDGTFAISNSEDLVHGVIDRKTGTLKEASRPPTTLDATERFQTLCRKLPDRALARLVIDSRLVESLIKSGSSHPPTAGEALIEGYIAALESVGAALVIQDDRLALHTAEVFNPRKFPELPGHSTAAAPAVRIDRVPSTTVGIGSVQLDFIALYKLMRPLVPEPEQARLSNAEIALQGILLGHNLQTRILPGLGPRVLAYVDAPTDWEPKSQSAGSPGPNWPFPTVLAVELADDHEATPVSGGAAGASVADALDNALNTFLALLAFDEKLARSRPRIVTRSVSGITVKSLDPTIPFAYAVDRDGRRLVVGNSVAAVDRYLSAGSDPEAGSRFRRLRATAFAAAGSWFCLDLAAVQKAVETHRARLTEMIASNEHRSREDVTRDLDQMLALVRVFDAAYLTSRIDTKSSTVLHTLGLLVRPVETKASTAKP